MNKVHIIGLAIAALAIFDATPAHTQQIIIHSGHQCRGQVSNAPSPPPGFTDIHYAYDGLGIFNIRGVPLAAPTHGATATGGG
jgi:hypothetical protein